MLDRTCQNCRWFRPNHQVQIVGRKPVDVCGYLGNLPIAEARWKVASLNWGNISRHHDDLAAADIGRGAV